MIVLFYKFARRPYRFRYSTFRTPKIFSTAINKQDLNFPMSNGEEVKAKIIEVRDLSSSVKGLTLSIPHPHFSFKAGQWVDFKAPGIEKVAGYSICSSPEELRNSGLLELAVKKSNFPPTQWVHEKCTPGMEVGLSLGGTLHFDLHHHLRTTLLDNNNYINNYNNNDDNEINNKNNNNKKNNNNNKHDNNIKNNININNTSNDNNKFHNNNSSSSTTLLKDALDNSGDVHGSAGVLNVLLVAGGVGVNPLLSIYRHLAHHCSNWTDESSLPRVNVHMLYCASCQDDLIFKDVLIELATETDGFSVEFIVTRNAVDCDDAKRSHMIGSSVTMTRGCRLSEEDLKSRLQCRFEAGRPLVAYVCGPYNMIDDTSLLLRKLGLQEENIRYEKWW